MLRDENPINKGFVSHAFLFMYFMLFPVINRKFKAKSFFLNIPLYPVVLAYVTVSSIPLVEKL